MKQTVKLSGWISRGRKWVGGDTKEEETLEVWKKQFEMVENPYRREHDFLANREFWQVLRFRKEIERTFISVLFLMCL